MQCRLSLRAPPLSASASRRAQTARPRASIRCAAAESTGFAQRLEHALVTLQGALSAPRVNKAKAQAQLGSVVTLAEAALADKAAAVKVAAAETATAVAAAEAEKKVVAAEAEKKVAAAEAEKKVAAAEAEEKVAAAEAKKKVAAAEAATAVALVEKKVALVEKENVVLEHELQGAIANILIAKGKLDARGLLEFAEDKLFPAGKGSKSRKARWEKLGERYPELEAAILKAIPSWKAAYIPNKACEVYSSLSAQVHSRIVLDLDKVALVEGVLNREQMLFLACVAGAVHCPYSMHHRQS